jgi:hypothetical protein
LRKFFFARFMVNYKKVLGVAAMAVALMGAGCSGSGSANVSSSGTTPTKTPTPAAETPKVAVKFSAVTSDLFGLAGKYSELTFTGGTGSCTTTMPYTKLSYSPSQPGYNYMLRDNGTTIDASSSSNTQSVLFDGKTKAGADVECKMMIPYGSDTSTLTCATAAGAEVCSATYTVMAQPE